MTPSSPTVAVLTPIPAEWLSVCDKLSDAIDIPDPVYPMKVVALETFLIRRYNLRTDDQAHPDIFGWSESAPTANAGDIDIGR